MFYRVIGPLVAVAISSGATSPPSPDVELVRDGRFAAGAQGWTLAGAAQTRARAGELCVRSPGGARRVYDTLVESGGLPLRAGSPYLLTLRARTTPVHAVHVVVTGPAPDFHEHLRADVSLTDADRVVELPFTADRDQVAQVSFQLGTRGEPFDFCVSSVSVRGPRGTAPSGEHVRNGDFARGATGWSFYGFTTTEAGDGRFCGEVPGGRRRPPWDVAVFQRSAFVERGLRYRVRARLSAGPGAPSPLRVRLVVGSATAPYTVYAEATVDLPPDGGTVVLDRTVTSKGDDPAAALTLQVGGASEEDWRLCLDDVSLRRLP